MAQAVLENETLPSTWAMRKLASDIMREARRESGFIITFKKSGYPEPIGFSFLASFLAARSDASIHGSTEGIGDRLTCEIVCFKDGLGYEGVVRQYLERTAAQIGMSVAKLAHDLCRKQFVWRFYGYVDGEDTYTHDNGLTWRALWGRIVEIATPERLDMTGVKDPGSMQFLIKRLRQCAIESQIVLDR